MTWQHKERKVSEVTKKVLPKPDFLPHKSRGQGFYHMNPEVKVPPEPFMYCSIFITAALH